MNRCWLLSRILWQSIFPGLIGGLWLVTPATAVSLTNKSEPPLEIAQAPLTESASPTTITGRLDANSPTLPEDGSYYQEHPFEGRAGEQIVIELSSGEFDTYLILISPNGEVIAQKDNGGSGTNSTIVITLPTTGSYTILANTYGAGATGSYRLELERRVATETERALAEAAQLNQRVIELSQSGRYEEATPLAERSLAIREQALGENHPEAILLG